MLNLSFKSFSIPSKTILTKRKDNISLCSILFSAYSVEVKKSEFKIPAFNQLFIWFLNVLVVLSFFSKYSCEISLKQFFIPVLKKYLGDPWICLVTIHFASAIEYPGLNPYEFESNLASHSGSNASFNNVCLALSFIVDIPNKPFKLPFGTQRIESALPSNRRIRTNSILSKSLRVNLPSTPRIFFSRLSCVTLRIATSFAASLFTRVFW